MNSYHEDEDSRLANERCAGIVGKDNKLLLIHRIKNGYEYYVFPGGHRRREEDPGDVVIREIIEETAVDVSDPELLFSFHDYRSGNIEQYFKCKWQSGETPHLNGEESIRQCDENQYHPEWISLNEIGKLNILPRFAKDWVMENYK